MYIHVQWQYLTASVSMIYPLQGGGTGDEVSGRDATVLGVCGDPEIAKVIPSHGKEGNKRYMLVVCIFAGLNTLCTA